MRGAWAFPFAAMIGLSGCDVKPPVGAAPPPAERAAPVAAPAPPQRARRRPAPADPGEESRELSKYYQRVQDSLLGQGLLRRERGGADTPFGQRQLVENFIRIALYDEYATINGRMVARPTPTTLHRWEQPVTMQLEFGPTVPAEKRNTDSAAINIYAARLARASGLPIRRVDTGGNFNVFIVNEEERRALAPRLRALVPGISELAVRTVVDMSRNTYCLVFALDGADNGEYTRAVAVIRGEHPDLLRLSCIHEELAQGLGLTNDSPAARPSIFNDDEEFALLTTHDELLLKMLYDPRMRPGMTAAEARPIAETIAAELLGGDS